MAKKRISRSRKRDLEQPDEFITLWTKLFRFASENRILLASALGAIVVLIIVVLGVVYYVKTSENQSFALLEQAMNKYQTAAESNGPFKAYHEVDSNFQSILEKYSTRRGGKLARFLYANICYDADKYNKAVELYNQSLADFKDEPFLKKLVLTSLGYAHKRQKDYPAAARFFEMVVKEPDSNMKDEALFNLGELYATMGDHDKSIEAFNNILSNYVDSMYIDIVKEKVKG